MLEDQFKKALRLAPGNRTYHSVVKFDLPVVKIHVADRVRVDQEAAVYPEKALVSLADFVEVLVNLNCPVVGGVNSCGMRIAVVGLEVADIVKQDRLRLVVDAVTKDVCFGFLLPLGDEVKIRQQFMGDVVMVLGDKIQGLDAVLIGGWQELFVDGDEDNRGQMIDLTNQLAELETGLLVVVDAQVQDKDVVQAGFRQGLGQA